MTNNSYSSTLMCQQVQHTVSPCLIPESQITLSVSKLKTFVNDLFHSKKIMYSVSQLPDYEL